MMETQAADDQEIKRKRTRRLIVAGVAAVLVVAASTAIYFKIHNRNQPTHTANAPVTTIAPETPATLGARTKNIECHINGPLPDSGCTPGTIIATAAKEQVCQPGYSKSVRNVPTSEKNAVYSEYGIASHIAGQYEVDHLISLELGGSNDIANLWPEPAQPTPGFHEKDKVENYLHDQVCMGKIALAAAQQEEATNWVAVYDKMPK